MTPQERALIDALFDRLARLEANPRDAQAEHAIADGLSRAPNAIYALVQTTLVQDEALKHADAQIRALEAELNGEAPAPAGNAGFLDSMRDSLFGRREASAPSRGSVPSVPARDTGSVWGSTGGGYAQPQQAPGGYAQPGAPTAPMQAGPMPGQGGSFLGTAAATAAGMIGGSLLLNSFRGMMGGNGGGQQHGIADAQGAGTRSPWGGNDATGSDLSREAGLNDIGAGKGQGGGNDRGQGFFDSANNDSGNTDYEDNDEGFDSADFDPGGFDDDSGLA